MPLPVLTIVGVGTNIAAEDVAPRPTVTGAANALMLASFIAFPRATRQQKDLIGTGSSQDHANEADRTWLQGVVLELKSLLLILRCLGPFSGPSNPPSCTQLVHNRVERATLLQSCP